MLVGQFLPFSLVSLRVFLLFDGFIFRSRFCFPRVFAVRVVVTVHRSVVVRGPGCVVSNYSFVSARHVFCLWLHPVRQRSSCAPLRSATLLIVYYVFVSCIAPWYRFYECVARRRSPICHYRDTSVSGSTEHVILLHFTHARVHAGSEVRLDQRLFVQPVNSSANHSLRQRRPQNHRVGSSASGRRSKTYQLPTVVSRQLIKMFTTR